MGYTRVGVIDFRRASTAYTGRATAIYTTSLSGVRMYTDGVSDGRGGDGGGGGCSRRRIPDNDSSSIVLSEVSQQRVICPHVRVASLLLGPVMLPGSSEQRSSYTCNNPATFFASFTMYRANYD